MLDIVVLIQTTFARTKTYVRSLDDRIKGEKGLFELWNQQKIH